jgi:hypothetical protein
MTVGQLRKKLEAYDDNDIVISESRGDNYTSPSVYDNGYLDIRNKGEEDNYFDSLEEALEAGVPKEFIRRQVLVTGHT